MLFSKKSREPEIKFDPDKQYAIIRSSICTGEKVAGFKSKVDASGVKGHLAVQADVYGEGEGAFYIEVKDGKVEVQPYKTMVITKILQVKLES